MNVAWLRYKTMVFPFIWTVCKVTLPFSPAALQSNCACLWTLQRYTQEADSLGTLGEGQEVPRKAESGTALEATKTDKKAGKGLCWKERALARSYKAYGNIEI